MEQLTWRKSSYSGGNGGECVEVADLADGSCAIRDSKNPTGPVLIAGPAHWAALNSAISRGDFG